MPSAGAGAAQALPREADQTGRLGRRNWPWAAARRQQRPGPPPSSPTTTAAAIFPNHNDGRHLPHHHGGRQHSASRHPRWAGPAHSTVAGAARHLGVAAITGARECLLHAKSLGRTFDRLWLIFRSQCSQDAPSKYTAWDPRRVANHRETLHYSPRAPSQHGINIALHTTLGREPQRALEVSRTDSRQQWRGQGQAESRPSQ